MARGSTALAERKEKISAAQAIEIVKKFVKDRHRADKTKSDRALAEANNFAGGASERLDKETIDFGRRWAIRLSLIARQTAGSGYQASRSGSAIAGTVKKVFAIVGELEAMLATDVEIGLFEKVKDVDYFGYNGLIKKMKVEDLTRDGGTFDAETLIETIVDEVGPKLQDDVTKLLEQYDIEIPKAPKQRRAAGTSVDGVIYNEDEHDGD